MWWKCIKWVESSLVKVGFDKAKQKVFKSQELWSWGSRAKQNMDCVLSPWKSPRLLKKRLIYQSIIRYVVKFQTDSQPRQNDL